MPSTTRHHRTEPRFTRRTVLQIVGAAGLAAATGPTLSACGRDEPEDASAPSPGSGGELSGALRVAIPMATDADQDFYTKQFASFTENTGVDVELLPFPDPQYEDSIQGLFRSGDEPDVYRMVKATASMRPSWSNDWIQPLDSYDAISKLLEDEYGDSALDPATSGLHLGGDLYGVPGVANNDWASLRPLMVNMDVLSEHGISSPPETWTELRDYAAKISSDSGSEVYGFALFGTAGMLIDANIKPMMECAGPVRQIAPLIPVDYHTGRAGASHPSIVEAVAVLRGMVEDKSVVPGWQNLEPEPFWQAWASGQVAMSPIAPWWAEEILKINDQIDVTGAIMPTPDAGRSGYQSSANAWAPTWGMTKATGSPEAAAALIAFLGSLDLQREYYEVSKVPTALASEYSSDLSETAANILGLAPELKRQGPSPTVRSLDAQGVIQAIQKALPTPGFSEIVFAAVDEGADYEDAARTFDDKLNDVMSAAISDAKSSGKDVDQKLFTFGDWDPMSDYTTRPGA